MALQRVLAHLWTFAINTGSVALPVWTPINGIESFSPSQSKQDADSTVFEDLGIESHQVASRSHSLTLSARFIEDPVGGARDPGQEAVEALALGIGTASLGQFKITTPGGTSSVATGSVAVTLGGGGLTDMSGWEAEVTFSGSVL